MQKIGLNYKSQIPLKDIRGNLSTNVKSTSKIPFIHVMDYANIQINLYELKLVSIEH